MPLYEYVCPVCGKQVEKLLSRDDAPDCPDCGAEIQMQRMISPCGARFVAGCGGFYKASQA